MMRPGLVIGHLSNGGAERQLFETCKGLIKRDVQPIVYCLSDRLDPYGPLLEHVGIPVFSFSRHSHFDLRRGWNLRRQIRTDGVDLVHSWLIDDNPYALLATLGTRVKFVASLRSRPLHRDRFRGWVDAMAFKAANRVLANSEEVGTYLRDRYHVLPNHVSVIENGINGDRLKPVRSSQQVRAALETPDRAFVFLFVGRLHPVKRIPLLLEAFSSLCQSWPDVYLWIAGEGEEKPYLVQLAQDLKIPDRIRFLGERDDVGALYHSSDVLVLCSESEGLPNVVLESLACGTPVLLSPDAGCCGIVQEGINGWYCRDMTPQGLSCRMNELVSKKKEISGNGQRIAAESLKRFDLDRMTEAMIKLYTEVLSDLK